MKKIKNLQKVTCVIGGLTFFLFNMLNLFNTQIIHIIKFHFSTPSFIVVIQQLNLLFNTSIVNCSDYVHWFSFFNTLFYTFILTHHLLFFPHIHLIFIFHNDFYKKKNKINTLSIYLFHILHSDFVTSNNT